MEFFFAEVHWVMLRIEWEIKNFFFMGIMSYIVCYLKGISRSLHVCNAIQYAYWYHIHRQYVFKWNSGNMYVLLSTCVWYHGIKSSNCNCEKEIDFMLLLMAMTPQCIFFATFCVPFSFLLVCLVLMLFVGFLALNTTLTWENPK